MSKTPRRLIGRAAASLAELVELEEKHPEIRAQLSEALGALGLTRLSEAHATLRDALAVLEAHGSPPGAEKP